MVLLLHALIASALADSEGTGCTSHEASVIFQIDADILSARVSTTCGSASVPLGSVRAAGQVVTRWRRALADPTLPVGAVDDAGRAVAERLWRPLEPHLSGAPAVTVRPAGPTWEIPWAGLPIGERYLVEQRLVAAMPTAPSSAAPAPPARHGLLLVGDIDYGEGQGAGPRACWEQGLPRLVHTASEVKAVRDIWKGSAAAGEGVTLLTGAAADEGAVGSAMAEARVIHLATHGFYLDGACAEALGGERLDPMLRSGLAMAGANQPHRDGQDGLLTAQEVTTLDLRGARLVVLSASVTALGKIIPGEGVQGLTRGFGLAGAQAVVASLWAVPDAETAWLMEVFYRRLLGPDPQPPAEAMRAAQLAQLEAERKRGDPDPRGWAQWILVGR